MRSNCILLLALCVLSSALTQHLNGFSYSKFSVPVSGIIHDIQTIHHANNQGGQPFYLQPRLHAGQPFQLRPNPKHDVPAYHLQHRPYHAGQPSQFHSIAQPVNLQPHPQRIAQPMNLQHPPNHGGQLFQPSSHYGGQPLFLQPRPNYGRQINQLELYPYEAGQPYLLQPRPQLGRQRSHYQPHSRNAVHALDFNAKPDYSFAYGVDDHKTGNSQNHKERRDGDKVSGEYNLVEPDGTLRTVKYTSDSKNGFQATVIYTPHSGGYQQEQRQVHHGNTDKEKEKLVEKVDKNTVEERTDAKEQHKAVAKGDLIEEAREEEREAENEDETEENGAQQEEVGEEQEYDSY